MSDDLRAALEWLIDHSIPTHHPSCAGQPDDAPCFCGVTERYEHVLSWRRDSAALATSDGLDVALRAWLLDQSRQAHEQANVLPGDPDHAWDAGAAHMADATLTWLSTWLEQR